MSTNKHADETGVENEPDDVETEEAEQVIGDPDKPIDYEPGGLHRRRTAYEVAKAWAAGEYPDQERADHDAGQLYSQNFKAQQLEDGTGWVRAGRQTIAYRTVSGLVITSVVENVSGGISRSIKRFKQGCSAEDVDVEQIRVDFIRGVTSQNDNVGRIGRSHPHHLTKIVDVEVDEGEGKLITFNNGDQLFIGKDETANGDGRFGFMIEENGPVPSPKMATDMLMPDSVLRARADGAEVERQGEWFFVPEEYVDVDRDGSLQKPGVGSRPYGASPLQNHVPRDWAPTVSDDEAVERFLEHDDVEFTSAERFGKPKSPQGVVKKFDAGDLHYESSLTWTQLREDVLDEVWVRGTVRHKENDHFVLNLGDEWHRCVTHNRDVYTEDDARIRMD